MTPPTDLVHDVAVADQRGDDHHDHRVRTLVVTIVLAGTVLLVVLALLQVLAIAERRAHAEARTRAAVVAAVVGAWVHEVDDPADGDAFARAIRGAAGDQGVSHVVVWRRDGSVAWADDPRLIGRTFAMHEDLRALFGSSGSLVGRPGPVDLEGAEAPTDVEDDLEIFAPTTGAAEEPLVVESYVVRSSLRGHRSDTARMLLPYLLAGLLVLETACLALVLLLVRVVRRSRRGRIKVTTAAVHAMESERRELAHQLHDGVVQDLAATRYALASIATAVPPGLDHGPREELDRIQELLREDLVELRTLLGHLLAPEVGSQSLANALRTLVQSLAPAHVRREVELDLRRTTPEEGLVVYRVVREGVSNAVQHADAATIRVSVGTREAGPDLPAHLEVVVEDDGRGPGTASTVLTDRGAHYGLVLAAGLVRDHGGTLTVTARADGPGTRLVATLPDRSLLPL